MEETTEEKVARIYREVKKIYACPYPDDSYQIRKCKQMIVQALSQGFTESDFIEKIKVVRAGIGEKTPNLHRQFEDEYWEKDLLYKPARGRSFDVTQR